jgi:hypothetical protein
VACTIERRHQRGQHVAQQMRGVPTPSARAASTIVCSRSESTEARTSRMTRGISG